MRWYRKFPKNTRAFDTGVKMSDIAIHISHYFTGVVMYSNCIEGIRHRHECRIGIYCTSAEGTSVGTDTAHLATHTFSPQTFLTIIAPQFAICMALDFPILPHLRFATDNGAGYQLFFISTTAPTVVRRCDPVA